jgi:glycosyltransferase involved in cell wall biosynthesis
VVVGHVHYPRFLQLAKELGMSDYVVCTGAVAKSQIGDYLAIADIESHDLQGYGLGTASLEAMAAGVPVVAAVRADNFPGIQLKSGENIVLVDPDDAPAIADAICNLLDDPNMAKAIGLEERSLVDRWFSMSAVTVAHLRALGALASRNTPTALGHDVDVAAPNGTRRARRLRWRVLGHLVGRPPSRMAVRVPA